MDCIEYIRKTSRDRENDKCDMLHIKCHIITMFPGETESEFIFHYGL